MDFWNAMSLGAAVGDALGLNASQKAALQLMAMQPDKVPQKTIPCGSRLKWTRRLPKHWKYSKAFQRIFEYRSARSRVFSHE